ncbi:MAG: hypothetical protein KGL10_09900 [Alphaproteobacteria bacterium]|nr:hypothetical protein [Alphaproteobacteria bacterium]MDE2337612.1 hypothetical protein [Alphaproteobacteria bacterium]
MAGKKDLQDGGKNRKASFSTRFALFAVLVVGAIFVPFTIVFFVCMIPTMVSAIVDNQPRKTAWLTIGAMNMAGMVPVWGALLDRGHTIQTAFQLVLQPEMLLVSYGGAFAGWVIYNKVTPLVARIIQIKNERRLQDIARRQEELVRKWGEKVVS